MDQTRRMKNNLADEILIAHWVATDKMRLFKSTFTPDQNSTIADFQANEVAFTGYSAVVLSSPWVFGLDPNGDWQNIYGGVATFAQTAITAVDIAGGFWVEDTAGVTGKMFFTFNAPFSFDTVGNTLIIKPSINGTFDGEADVESVVGP